MAKSFRELGKKAENLIEQGREADQKVQSCQARVSAASSRVAAARSQLAAASETDEEGRPQGDVEQARVQLRVAEGQLAASRRALTEAQGAVGRIKQEKTAHVREIEQHNKTERSNLEKLRQLRAGAFGENAAAMSEGIAQRLNEAEDARAALLRSMGMEATPDYVTVSEGGGGTTTWLGGSFAFMDTSGQTEQYQGTGMGGGVAAPVGGGLGSAVAAPVGGGLGSAVAAPVGGGLGSAVAAPVGGGLGALGNPTQNGTGIASGQPGESAYEQLLGADAQAAAGIDHLVAAQMAAEGSDAPKKWNGRPRSPNQALADLRRSVRENWMNNFNADEWKRILPEKLYQERLALYRKGIAVAIGEKAAAGLSTEDLEQLSRVQNRAYLSECQLTQAETAELYRSAVNHQGNFVTSTIERKMDGLLQDRAHGLLKTEKYSQQTWQKLSMDDKKAVLSDLITDMNSILGTNVSADIDFFHEQSGSRGAFSASSNNVRINEFLLAKDSSYQLTQTIIHEMRHAYQHHCVKNSNAVLVSSQTIKKWEDNLQPGHYKSPKLGYSFEEYLAQPVEWDAKNFAKQLSEMLGIQPEYKGSWN